MKISAKQYARSLYESLAGKSEAEVRQILAVFVRLLGRNRDLVKVREILTAFSDIWDREAGEVSAELVTARPADKSQADIKNYLQARTQAQAVKLSAKIDPSLVGGFILRYRDRILDASLKTNLQNLQDKLGR